MDSTVFKQYYKDITKALREQRLNDALALEENILYTNPSWPFMDEVISIRQTYQGLLGCLEHGFRDDTRKESFNRLILQSYRLLHMLARYYKKEMPNSLYSKTCLQVKQESYRTYEVLLKSTTEQLDKSSEDIQRVVLGAREQCALDLFNQIWTTGSFSALDVQELRNLLNSEEIQKKDVLLCLSALMFQQSLCPDSAILSLIIEQSLRPDMEIKIRSTIIWLLLLLRHEKEYLLDNELKDLVLRTLQNEEIQDIICDSLNHILLSQESRSLISKLQNEVLPLLSNGKMLHGTEEEAQKLIRKSMKKIEKLMNSGADVQFGSFMLDKNYSFFKQLGNWLLPFDEHHSETEFVLRGEEPPTPALRLILRNSGLCDNDKWSLFFKTRKANIPIQMQGLSPEELEMMSNSSIIPPRIYNRNFVHDIYRVYNLFPYRIELDNLLALIDTLEPYNFLLKNISHDKLSRLAKALYASNQHSASATVALMLLKDDQYAFEANKIIGDICRMSADYEEAVEYYEDACALKQEKDTYMQLAYCYRQTEQYRKAASIYQALQENQEEDLALCKQLATCLVLCRDTEKAIPLLYKIAYLDENEQDFAHSSLAWCYLLDGKLEEAWATWEKIGKKSLTDMLNGGHISWAMQDYQNAMDFYKYYLSKSTDRGKAEEQMFNDVKIMKKYKLTKLEVRLILEINR